MAKRDPEKTARNKEVAEIKVKLRGMLPKVLKRTGYGTEATLNAKIGSKTDLLIDLKHEVINSAEEFTNLWLQKVRAEGEADKWGVTPIGRLWHELKQHKALQDYLFLFLRRSYLKRFEEFSKSRPRIDQSTMWIGQNHADWGLLVTPRFVNDEWENDNSHIRRFKPRYWSIGHILKTGLVVPGKKRRRKFADVEDYLTFFQDVLVRSNKSKHGNLLAQRYVDFVRLSKKPEDVLLLIPELRYAGRKVDHEYRLDFCAIDVASNSRVGFELSPWSSHGQLGGTKLKTTKAINAEASANFAKEARKCQSFFRAHGITVLIYTDDDLADPDALFKQIAKYLVPKAAPRQLSLHIRREIFR